MLPVNLWLHSRSRSVFSTITQIFGFSRIFRITGDSPGLLEYLKTSCDGMLVSISPIATVGVR